MARSPEPQSFIDMFARLGRDLNLPGVDIERIIEHHRKNIEALERSAKAASEGAGAVLSKQQEILQKTFTEISEMAQNYRVPANPQELVATQADLARKSFETAVRNTSEMAELIGKSGTESIEILRERIRESMREIRDSYEKRK